METFSGVSPENSVILYCSGDEYRTSNCQIQGRGIMSTFHVRTARATEATRAATQNTVLLVHTDQNAEHLRPGDDQKEHSAMCIISSKTLT